MQMPRIVIIFTCLCTTGLFGQSLNTLPDMEEHLETPSKTHELETANIHPSGEDTGPNLLHTYVSSASVPVEAESEAEEVREHQGADARNSEAGRSRRSAWARLGQVLNGWMGRVSGEEENGALMAVLKDLVAEKWRLMPQGKTQKEEEEDDDEENDDDEEEEEEEEEEGGQEQENGVEVQEEEEQEQEATESPSNQTEADLSFTECQIADTGISCRGIGLTYLPVIDNLEATNLDVAENNISMIGEQDFSGLPNLDTLDLSKNKLDDESFGPNSLTNLNSLKKLNLDGNQLTTIPALPSSLEVLKISMNALSALTPDSFQGLNNLLILELQGNTLHEASVSPLAFRPLQTLLELQLNSNLFRFLPVGIPPTCERLHMQGNLIEELTEGALRECIHLRVLDLSQNRLHEQGISSHAWTWLKSLESLDLSYNQFTSVPMDLPRQLRKLILQHNNIHNIPAFAFRHLQPGLQSLQLSHNALNNEGVEHVSFVGTYRSLGELLLDNNVLEDVPGCVRQFKNLQVLRLDNNHVRMVREWSVCHPRNSGSTLATVHLENNFLQVDRIPQKAFSCLIDIQGLVLYPQQELSYNQ